jgi:hypothetical protein
MVIAKAVGAKNELDLVFVADPKDDGTGCRFKTWASLFAVEADKMPEGGI